MAWQDTLASSPLSNSRTPALKGCGALPVHLTLVTLRALLADKVLKRLQPSALFGQAFIRLGCYLHPR